MFLSVNAPDTKRESKWKAYSIFVPKERKIVGGAKIFQFKNNNMTLK